MSAKPLALVVTGAGAPGIRGTIYALRNNPEGRRVRIVGVDTDPDAVGRHLADAFYTVPPPEDEAYLEVLVGICRRENVGIVLPQTTREISKLARSKVQLEQQAVCPMVSDPAAIEVANDKWALLVRFRGLGLPFPAFHLARDQNELVNCVRELGYPARPVAIKPPLSNGMRGVRILRPEPWDVTRFLSEKPLSIDISLEALLDILRRGPGWPKLLVTEYLPGPEYTVDAFVGEKFSIAIPRLRKAVRSGITFFTESEFREDLSEYTLGAARAIGLRYAFGFQFKLDTNGVPKVLECNPRIQGTMVASVFSGANVIWFGVKELLGEPVAGLDHELTPAFLQRFWGGIGGVDGCVHEI